MRASALRLRSGENQLRIDGVYDDSMNLTFTLDAPNLAGVVPGVSGSVAGKGAASGSWQAPGVTLSLIGTDVAFEEYSLRSLSLEAEVAASERSPWRVKAEIFDARMGTQHFSSIDLVGDGTLAAHSARATIESSFGDLSAHLRGGVKDDRWRGVLSEMKITTPSAGRWRLRDPAALVVDRKTLALERTCLIDDAGSTACASLEHAMASGDVNALVDLRGLPLALMEPWLPAGATLSGQINADAEVVTRSGKPKGTVSIVVSNGALELPQGKKQRLYVSHAETKASVRLDGDLTQMTLGSVIADDGRVAASVTVNGFGPDAKLDGTVNARLPRLDIVAAFLPGLDGLDGVGHVQATVHGTLSAPSALGTLSVEVTGARVLDLGIELTETELVAEVNARQDLVLRGKLSSGGGQLTMRGEGLLRAEAGFPLELVLAGEDLEILRVPTAQVFASPELKVSIRDARVAVTGRVLIPRAEITPKEIADSAVKVSADEVLINQPAGEAGIIPETRPVSIDVVVELGDEVIFDGFGLTSRLTGKLSLQQGEDGITTGNGDLNLVGGQFSAYGQRLEIERGRLLFAGPLDNPGLDVRAVRKTGNITAGILIGGTVSQLSSRIFSEPALGEAEALSYLLTGRGLSGASQGDAALLSQAAVALGLQGSGLITGQIKSTLGLDELSVGGSGESGDSSLILGKRLTPDVTVRYALGLFDAVGALFLNYRLSDNLSLEAESGARQGLDVLFNIERDSVLP